MATKNQGVSVAAMLLAISVCGETQALETRASETQASDCGVTQELRKEYRKLGNWIGVSKRDRAFIQGYGLPLQTNALGATYVLRTDLLNGLSASGCDADLRKWTIRKASAPRRQSD
ncbi:MAG: hypothetical protein ACU0BB_12155 [Paracoccaceae bacterium]